MTHLMPHLGQELGAAGTLVDQDGKDIGQMWLKKRAKFTQNLGEKV